ncbi:MAG: hypothetical protein SH850_28725 [Planctomycetaceae bacterium]|nr:hypothetical protein [Planctomycetaceae bacterium]
MTITFEVIEFDNAGDAIQHYEASGYGDGVIALDAKYYVTKRAETDRLAEAGIEFAYVFDHEMPDGEHRIMTVPVN